MNYRYFLSNTEKLLWLKPKVLVSKPWNYNYSDYISFLNLTISNRD